MDERTSVTVGTDLQMALHLSGRGEPVVLLHGIPGSGAGWGPVARMLATRRLVVVPDLLGFGKSSRPRSAASLWADRQAAAVATALDALGITSAAVVAHDFGGPVAFHLLRIRRELVSHLAVASTNAFTDTPIPFPLTLVLPPVIGSVAARALFSGPGLRRMVRDGAPGERRPAVETGDRSQRRATRIIFTSALRELEPRYAPVTDGLPHIDVPCLVAWGDRDPFFPVEQGRRTAAAIPGARFVTYPDTGHFVPQEQPDAFAADVLRLLAQPRAGEPAARAEAGR